MGDDRFNQQAAFESARKLSPRRNTSEAGNLDELVREQLNHFCIDPQSAYGQLLGRTTKRIYQCQADVDQLWILLRDCIQHLDHKDRIAFFNAKKFLCFQMAKVLDTLQAPFRKTYQNLSYAPSTLTAKGAYPIFDNVTALFSATPVIARTATYIYACTEWIEDAFNGRELLLEIYSRLLNPTSLSLANFIVDLEAGAESGDYLAWNFNSGMAAIDAVLSHTLGRDDILITSRNIYGGTHQLIHDWYAKPSNMNIEVASFDGHESGDFLACWQKLRARHPNEDLSGKTYVFLESPSNPHGYVLDVAAICKQAHDLGLRVILDATVGTPFLSKPLQRRDPAERPDFLIHSYTKDLSGSGSVIAGTVIGRNRDMFIPKGDPGWEQTMFWNVYYIKGGFLNADTAFEVMQGMRTLELRMLGKCINTEILCRFLDSHPDITVNGNILENNANTALRAKNLYLGLPAPLFTFRLNTVQELVLKQLFDILEPTYGHMVSLGQTNTIISCPGLTTHSELNQQQLKEAGIDRTTIRVAVGNENIRDLATHFVKACEAAVDKHIPGFSRGFMSPDSFNRMAEFVYLQAHAGYIKSHLQNARPASQTD